jgi:hypothetical protein
MTPFLSPGRRLARQGRHPGRLHPAARRRAKRGLGPETEIYEYDVLFLEWAADAAATFVEDGIDTFVFRDGLIRVQTVRYTVQRKG